VNQCVVHNTPRKWKSWLALAEFWYNTFFYSSLGCTPFKALHGYDPVVAAAPMVPSTSNKSVQELLTDRTMHTELLKQHLAAAQNMIKAEADKQRTDREFELQSSVVNRPCPKLAYKFFGPYKVLERIGEAAYKLELPSDSLIHPMLHLS
jgi:hypothetical protein